MSQNRKVCLYRTCDHEQGKTLFKFPSEKERFLIWVENAGVELEGDVDINAPRYLCEKHFSANYISTQSRRKMLVHTAVPEKWCGDVEIGHESSQTEIKFNLIGGSSEKKPRKNHHSPRELPTHSSTENTPNILNNKRKLQEDDYDMLKEEFIDEYQQQSQESVSIDHVEPAPPPVKRTYIVKQRNINTNPKTIMNYIRPSTTSNKIKDEETFFVTEEGNISSSSGINKLSIVSSNRSSTSLVNTAPATTTTAPTAGPQKNSIENCSEFIFGGEIYVQMPKRIFEDQMEKLRQETLKYKNMLLILKNQIDTCIEN